MVEIQGINPIVTLDATAGNRMMWPVKNPPLTVFLDKQMRLKRPPDVFAVWEKLPFRADVFECVIFDPPHGFNRRTRSLWESPDEGGYYGREITRVKLVTGILHGAREFAKVARRLCLKWSDDEISLNNILGLIKSPWFEIYRRRVRVRPRVHGNYTWWVTFVRHD